MPEIVGASPTGGEKGNKRGLHIEAEIVGRCNGYLGEQKQIAKNGP
jgi:hypothetical protein